MEPRAHGELQGAPFGEILDELPLNATGKVLKYQLDARAMPANAK